MAKINEYQAKYTLSGNEVIVAVDGRDTFSIPLSIFALKTDIENLSRNQYSFRTENDRLYITPPTGSEYYVPLPSGGGGTTLTQSQLNAIARAQTLTDTYIRNLFESGEGVSY